MTDPPAELRDALDQVPRVFLSSEDERILTDARTSVDILDSLVSPPIAVVLVGCTGVGKSHLVNELVGAEVSEVGVLRPTTRSVVMAGSKGPAMIDHASEYVVVPQAAGGMVFVDTPGWDVDRGAVEAALASADLAVLVVSPSRYGDALTRDVWDATESAPSRTIVLNRLSGTGPERLEILASIGDRFGGADVVTVDEHGSTDLFVRSVLEGVVLQHTEDDRAAIARSAASKAGRYLAGAVTARATDLRRLGDAVDATVPPEIPDRGMAVLESWSRTERALVGHVRKFIDDLDRAIVVAAQSEVSQRMLESMERWDGSGFERTLDEWRSAAAARFRLDAKIRWRRASGEQLLDETSWKVGVNPTLQVGSRVKRLMGQNLESAIRDVHEQLVVAATDAVLQRREVWRSAIMVAGSFKPGELLAAAEALGGS